MFLLGKVVCAMSKNPGTSEGYHSILPSLVRLLIGIIMLAVVQNIIVGFPGMTQALPTTSLTAASLTTLAVGLAAAMVVLKFGPQLSSAIADAYYSVKAYVPLLTYFFQIAALWILYVSCKGVSSGLFTSAPWAYPLIFLALAIIPTIRVVASIVQSLEGQTVHNKHVTRDQF